MSFLLQLSLFLVSSIVLLYLPAEFLLSLGKVSLYGWRRVCVGFVVGMMFFTVVGYFFAFTSLRILVFPFLMICAGISLWWCRRWIRYVRSTWAGPHAFLMLFALLFSLSVVTSGWTGSEGLYLRGVNNQDGLWNLALINELKETFPPQHPLAAGITLRGYHFFYNFMVAEFSRITNIDTLYLHFHFFSLLMSILMVYGIYEVSNRLSLLKSAAIWSTFFAVAGGSFAFVLPIFFGQPAGFDGSFGVSQPMSLLVSPSFVSSLICLLYTFILLDEYIKKPTVALGIVVILLGGVAVGFKVYAGMILIPTLVWIGLIRLIKFRRWDVLAVAVGSFLLTAAIFLPFNASYGFLVYQLLWPPHRVMQSTLDFTQWELKRQTYERVGDVVGLVKLEFIALAIFIFGNLGTRIVGILGINRFRIRDMTVLSWMLLVSALISFLTPMFFIQPIGAFNMIQFFWYFLVFAGIFAGWGVARWLSRTPKAWRVIVGLLLILLTIPSAVENLYAYTKPESVSIPTDELQLYRALERIGDYNETLMAVPLLDRYDQEHWESWFHTSQPLKAVVFSHKRGFWGDEIVQFPYEEWKSDRLSHLVAFMQPQNGRAPDTEGERDALAALRFLQQTYGIRYIISTHPAVWFDTAPQVKKIFHNSYGNIYEVLPL